jgi:hypothetical protein
VLKLFEPGQFAINFAPTIRTNVLTNGSSCRNILDLFGTTVPVTICAIVDTVITILAVIIATMIDTAIVTVIDTTAMVIVTLVVISCI